MLKEKKSKPEKCEKYIYIYAYIRMYIRMHTYVVDDVYARMCVASSRERERDIAQVKHIKFNTHK